MKLSLSKKMVGMGVLVFIAISVVFGISKYASNRVHVAMEKSAEGAELVKGRMEQLSLVNQYEHNLVLLTLAAMDAIIDKSDGKVAEELMHEINTTTQFLKETRNCSNLWPIPRKRKPWPKALKQKSPNFRI